MDPKNPKNEPRGIRRPPSPPRGPEVGFAPDNDGPDGNAKCTITKAAEGEGKFIRQSGGRNQYGHVMVKIEPRARNAGNQIVSDVASEAIPARYIKSVIYGIKVAVDGGMVLGDTAVDGHPVVDIVVRIVGGSFHEIDSNDLAFKMAGIFAIKEAVKKADPVIIE